MITPTDNAKHLEDQHWANLAKAGNKPAFTNLVKRYHRPIYNLCYRMLNHTAAAEDATQETFLRAYLKLHTYTPTRRFSSWLYAIASHYCLDQLKRVRPQLITWDEAPPYAFKLQQDHQPEMVFLYQETTNEVQGWLAALPSVERMAIVLKYWHQLSCKEIAQILNITPKAVKSRLFRARRKLAKVATDTQQRDVAYHHLPTVLL